GIGIVVVAEVGLLDLDVAELHLVEQVAGELAAGARKVRAIGGVGIDHAPHPQLRQHREADHQGQDNDQCSHEALRFSLSPPAGRGPGNSYFHTSLAMSTIMASLAHCCSSVSTLPSSVEAKPHCGDRQSWSRGAYLAASSRRRLMSSFLSSVPLLEVTRPTTTRFLPLGRKRSGSSPPARSVSYSRK